MEKDNKPVETDAGEEVVDEGAVDQQVDEGKADAGLEELFADEAGQEDVAGKGDLEKLSLEELNNISGRKFESKDAFFKHYTNLKSLVGDQKLAKERKEAKKEDESTAKQEIASLKKDLAKEKFLNESPTAKPFADALEAYADKHSMSLSEAWNSESFKPIAEASQRISKSPITNNRITPVQSQTIEKLKQEVLEKGTDTAKEKLVSEWFK